MFVRIALFLLTALWTLTAAACDDSMSGELWIGRDRPIAGADAAAVLCNSSVTAGRFGATYFVDPKNTYKGITGSIRLQVGHYFTPYVGIGGLFGEGEREVAADNDDVDNNLDGVVDEHGEKQTKYDFGIFAYPEAGVALCIGGVGLTVTARRFYGVDFNGELIVGAGISVCGKLGADRDALARPVPPTPAVDAISSPYQALSCDAKTEVRMCRSGTYDCRCETSSFEDCLASGLCLDAGAAAAPPAPDPFRK